MTLLRSGFLCTLLVVTSGIVCGVPRQRNLTQLLIVLTESRNERISFSPSLTDSVYPDNQVLNDSIPEVLEQLLNGTGLTFGRVKGAHYYIFGRILRPSR